MQVRPSSPVSAGSGQQIASSSPALELLNIDKHFGGVHAVRNVSLHVHAGEVLALAGENGAGKSTLVGVASGRVSQDSGRVLVGGEVLEDKGPAAAAQAGVRLVPQELLICPDMSVVENVLLGQIPRKSRLFVDRTAAKAETKRRLVQLHAADDIDLDAPVALLPVVQRAFIQIARGLTPGASVMLIDEPTAPMDASAVDSFLKVIEALTSSGLAIIYISHRLDEIFHLADRICIMRDGRIAAELTGKEMNHSTVIDAMVGSRELRPVDLATAVTGPVALQATALSAPGISDVSFDLAAGEMLAVYGISGSGRESLGAALVGATKATSGRVKVNGKRTKPGSVVDAVAHGVGYVPAERRTLGLDLEGSVAANLTLAMFKRLSSFGFLRRQTLETTASTWVDRLQIRTPGVSTAIGALSGGSQQKVLLARWLAAEAQVLVLEEPTRGVDVATKAEIYRLLNEMVCAGAAVLVITSDIEEAALVSERVLVMRQGTVAADLRNPSQSDLARVGQTSKELIK